MNLRRMIVMLAVAASLSLGLPSTMSAAYAASAAPAVHATAHTPEIRYPCFPLGRGNSVHIASTPPNAAAGQAWWLNNGCNDSFADVCITLQESLGGTWQNEAGPNCKILAVGNQHQVGARRNCLTNTWRTWRSHVTVDVVGPFGYGTDSTYTPNRSIPCTV